MNVKKINELAEKAGFVFWKDEKWGPGPGHIDWSSGYDEEFLKYTELIVRECAGVAHGSDMPGKDIKEHFGVKE